MPDTAPLLTSGIRSAARLSSTSTRICSRIVVRLGGGRNCLPRQGCCGADAFDWLSFMPETCKYGLLLKYPPFHHLVPCTLLQPAWSRGELTPSSPLLPVSSNPSARAPAAASRLQFSTGSIEDIDTADDSLIGMAADRVVVGMIRVKLRSGSILDSYGGAGKGDPTDYTFPVPSQQPQSFRVSSGLGVRFCAQWLLRQVQKRMRSLTRCNLTKESRVFVVVGCNRGINVVITNPTPAAYSCADHLPDVVGVA